MRKTLLAIWLLLPVVAFSQNTPPIGDVYQSGTPQPVEQAFQKLYQITAQITANPSSFYLKAQADKSNWPTVDQAQAQWDNADGCPGGHRANAGSAEQHCSLCGSFERRDL